MEGRFRLIVPHEKLGMRWVKQLTSLSIRPVGEPAGRNVPERRNPPPSRKD